MGLELLKEITMATKTNHKTRGASSSSSSPPAKRHKITVAPFVVAFPRRTRLSSTQWVNNVPFHVWVSKILNPFLDLKALSTVGRCNTFFEELWQYVLKQNIIRVPEDFPTMNQGMDMAVVFSERNECTPENPVRVVVGEGQFAVVGRLLGMTVSCSHITFVGKGKGKTTMLGGFQVDKQQHVKFEELAVTNHRGYGLNCTGGGTNVDVTECCFTKCKWSGICVNDGATATATRCDFMENGQCGVGCFGANTKVRLNDSTMHHNGMHGLAADSHAVVDLHGTKMDIHSNKEVGVLAYKNGKVNIHLPSQYNTSHDNLDDNRAQQSGGSIANINADGTFTHVEEVEIDDDY